MRTGRPKKYMNSVTLCITMENKQLEEIDKLRGSYSRGEFLNILSIEDNLKTKKIIDLKEENEKLKHEIEKSRKKDDSKIIMFQKSIHSNFRKYYIDYFEKMDLHKKRFWAKELNCRPQDLIDYV